MAVAVSFGLIARRADQAPFRRSEPRIVETVRRRCVRLVERSRFGDRADGNFSQLVGGVEAEGDAVIWAMVLHGGGAVAVGGASRCCS